MDKLKTGGDNALGSVSTALPPQKPDTQATLQQAKYMGLCGREEWVFVDKVLRGFRLQKRLFLFSFS